jgi:hypothetical protein
MPRCAPIEAAGITREPHHLTTMTNELRGNGAIDTAIRTHSKVTAVATSHTVSKVR